MTETNWREEHDKLEHTLAEVSNLVAALQLVAWEVAGLGTNDPIGRERRDAVVGIGDALEKLVRPT